MGGNMAGRDSAEGLSNSETCLSRLPGGLPAEFGYNVVKSAADAKALSLVSPSWDRGHSAVGLYHHHGLIGADVAYGGLLVAWDRDHREAFNAFGSHERFVAALKNTVPPHNLDLPTRINFWPGTITDGTDPLWCSIGRSWTHNHNVVRRFALHGHVPALQPSLLPVVLRASIGQAVIVAERNARAEHKAILDLSRSALADSAITLDGTDLSLSQCRDRLVDFCPDENVFDHLIADWRLASAPYQRVEVAAPSGGEFGGGDSLESRACVIESGAAMVVSELATALLISKSRRTVFRL
jgi:hypothetical protein